MLQVYKPYCTYSNELYPPSKQRKALSLRQQKVIVLQNSLHKNERRESSITRKYMYHGNFGFPFFCPATTQWYRSAVLLKNKKYIEFQEKPNSFLGSWAHSPFFLKNNFSLELWQFMYGIPFLKPTAVLRSWDLPTERSWISSPRLSALVIPRYVFEVRQHINK